MGKEMNRFLVFCSLVCMLAGNLFAESLNAQSSKQNGQGAAMNNQTGFSLSVPSEYTRQASQRGTYMKASDITIETKIRDVISNPSLSDWGRLLFPANEGYWSGDTL